MEGFSDTTFQAETTRLKRALTVEGQLPAHRCQYCEALLSAFNPPLDHAEMEGTYVNEELFNVVVWKAQMEEHANLGCKWWSMVGSLAKALPGETSTSGNTLDKGNDEDEQCQKRRDLKSIRVRLTRMVPFDLKWRMVDHRLDVSTPEGDDTEYRHLMVVGRPDNSRRGTEHLASPINLQPGSASSFSLMRHWLKHCINSHGCGIMNAPPSMPRILLDVQSEVDNIGQIRIAETGSHLRSPYVALSYCWGPQGQKVFLTKQNKKTFLEGIGLEQLDTSIQDAIKVTRELGFRYLWIDALCIVQDDDVDKANDIAHMYSIYQNAAITIVASRSATVTEGFLYNRKPAGAGTPETIFSLDGNNITAIPRQVGINEPWGYRAWTFQESLSSGRCLVFSSSQTHWNCQRGKSLYKECDGWFQYQQHTASVTDDRRTFRLVTDIMNGKNTGLDREGLLFIWHELIISYSERVISFHRDRLPAVSSIAQAFARVLDDEYICGHWRSNLHADLLWKSMFHRQKIPNTISWSWASSYGPLWRDWYPGRLVADADFRVLDFTPTYVSDGDPHGAVHSAVLTLRGLLTALPPCPASLSTTSKVANSTLTKMLQTTDSSPEQSPKNGEEGHKAHVNLSHSDAPSDLERVVWEEGNFLRQIYKDLEGASISSNQGPIGLSEEGAESPLYLFITGRAQNRLNEPQTVAGLLLQYAGRQDTFRRAGRFKVCPWPLHWLQDQHDDSHQESISGETLDARFGMGRRKATADECTERLREVWGGVGSVRTVHLI